MSSFHRTTVGSAQGGQTRVFSRRPLERSGERPVVLFLHGSLSSSGSLQHWADRLDPIADVVFIDLPSHGESDPIADMSLVGIAQHIFGLTQALLGGRRILLVGESLGGTVGLAIGTIAGGSAIRAVFAADPPLTTAKLWSAQDAHRACLQELPPEHPLHAYAYKVFGLKPDGVEERIYYPLLGRLQAPAVIAAGDTPLFPPRSTAEITTVFDLVDEFVVRNLYADRVQFERFRACGHLVLHDAVEPSQAIIQRLLSGHLTPG